MSTLVTFYALSNDASEEQNALESVASSAAVAEREIKKAAELLLECSKTRMKTTVLCASQAQAEAVDEYIWQYPPDSFIPHNLYGEGPAAGTPAEIIWQSAYASMTKLRNRNLVINLSGEFIDKHKDLQHIIDFVPEQEEQKVAARTRYKQYKQAGCQLEYKSA